MPGSRTLLKPQAIQTGWEAVCHRGDHACRRPPLYFQRDLILEEQWRFFRNALWPGLWSVASKLQCAAERIAADISGDRRARRRLVNCSAGAFFSWPARNFSDIEGAGNGTCLTIFSAIFEAPSNNRMPNPGGHQWFERLGMDDGCKSVGGLRQQNLNVRRWRVPKPPSQLAEVKLPCADKFVIKSEISNPARFQPGTCDANAPESRRSGA